MSAPSPHNRLAAAYGVILPVDRRSFTDKAIAQAILAADPTIAQDMELGRRIRDANDPLLEDALLSVGHRRTEGGYIVAALRAALTATPPESGE